MRTLGLLVLVAVACFAAEPDGTTPLHWAVRANDLGAVNKLLAAGADAKAANRYGVTPL
jgi:ankyrin repeat protein